jgi:membrane protease YdiL (CAAX protease family)
LDPTTRKAAIILSCIAAGESAWVVAELAFGSPRGLLRYLGFGERSPAAGWVLAAAVAGLWVAVAARLPSVRANLFRPSWLKLLAVVLAVAAAACEEAVFRKLVMNGLAQNGFRWPVQLAASAVAFGVAHSVWGLFRGSLRVAASVTVVTGALGLLLSAVFLASGRDLLPCVASHFAINLFVEPGLVLAAVRGEMRTSPP